MSIYIRQGHESEGPHKLSTLDLVTKLVLPVLSLLVSLVAIVKDARMLAWAFGALVVLLLLVNYWPAIDSRMKALRSRRRDDHTAREVAPQFLRLLRRFESFIGFQSNQASTLHEILSSHVCNRDAATLNSFCLPSAYIFTEFCCLVEHRACREVVSAQDLFDVVEQLNLMLVWFCSLVTEPVFTRFPQEHRILLTDTARSNLEAFRERFISFIDDYSDFLKSFDESPSGRQVQIPFFPRPKPL